MKTERTAKMAVLYRMESWFFGIAAAILAVMILWIVFADPVICVSGCSMNPTYQDGEYLSGDRVRDIDDLAHGDVIVLRRPDFVAEMVIKRVIGLPGDTVRISEDGVSVNGNPVEDDFPMTVTKDMVQEIVVGEDEVFVLGDNRDHSVDGRYFGTAPLSLVKYRIKGSARFAESRLFSLVKKLLLVG